MLLFFSGTIQAFTPKIFFINLYLKSVDVRLGTEDNPVFAALNIQPKRTTVLVPLDRTGIFNLYFKVSTRNEWTLWTDENDNPYLCNITDNTDNCIVIGSDKSVGFFYLPEDNTPGPKISFINGTDSLLARMEIGTEWGNPQAYTENLSPNRVSSFVTIMPGDYSLFWQYQDQKATDRYFFDPDLQENMPQTYALQDDHYYLFLAFSDGQADFGNLFVLTPQGSENAGEKRKGSSMLED